MLEIFVAMAASLIIFALLSIVFFVKGRSEEKQPGKATCGRCSCQNRFDTIPPPPQTEHKCGADQR
jgi:hypothetical protein